MVLTVPDMSCEHCVKRITAALKSVSGVDKIEIDLSLKKVVIQGNADETAVVGAIKNAGYTAHLQH